MEVRVGHKHIVFVVTANVRLFGGAIFRNDLDMGLVAGPRRRRGRLLRVKGGLDDVTIGVGVAQIVVAVGVEVADEDAFGVFGRRERRRWE